MLFEKCFFFPDAAVAMPWIQFKIGSEEKAICYDTITYSLVFLLFHNINVQLLINFCYLQFLSLEFSLRIVLIQQYRGKVLKNWSNVSVFNDLLLLINWTKIFLTDVKSFALFRDFNEDTKMLVLRTDLAL